MYFYEKIQQGSDGMEFVKSADVVVIGGGIVGTAVLRELSKYDLKCVLLEKEPDIALIKASLPIYFHIYTANINSIMPWSPGKLLPERSLAGQPLSWLTQFTL